MLPKASNLPDSTKQEILSQIRRQVGSEQYDRLVDNLGEDGLIDAVLAKMAEGSSASKSYAGRRIGRDASAIAGVVLGVVIGVAFFGASWLLNGLAHIPLWHSLAALTDSAAIALVVGGLVALQSAEKRKLDFRNVLWSYTLVSLVGGLVGAGRWLFHIEASLLKSLWDSSNTLLVCGFGIALIIGLLLWLATGSFPSDLNETAGYIWLGLLLVGSVVAVLVDAPLLTPWFSTNVNDFAELINQNALLVIPAIVAGLGGLLGLMLPPAFR
jgi:hypothetical protein